MNVAERVSRGAAGALVVARCLGGFRLEDPAGNQLQFRTRKAKALIALLAVNGRPMSRTAAADLLWSDRGPAQARASLRQTLFELQHMDSRGTPLLEAAREELFPRGDTLVTDLQLIRLAAAEGDWPRLLTLLESSASGLLTDLDGLDPEFDDWLRLQRAHEPAKSLAAAVEAAGRCAIEAGPRAGLDLVEEILRLDPVNEGATRLAMRLAAQGGDRVALHRHFAALRERLREDYEAEPAPETVALFAKLASGRPPDPAAVAEPPAAAAQRTSDERPRPSRRVMAILACTLLIVASAALLFVTRSGAPASANGPIVVAVLPFEQQPPDGSFIAAGLWEQTRGAMTRNRSIEVLGRTTTEFMAGQKLSPSQFRARFGVTHLVEGTVRRNGADLLVSVSLTRTSDGVAVWQDSFRGRTGEPFALQSAIADGIEGKLRARLAPGGGRRAEQIATSPEVYALYSEARQLIASRDHVNTRRAEVLLRQAVSTDPNYAPAWSLLGAAIHFNGRLAIADSSARAAGIADVQHALALAPDFAPAHAALALIEGDQSQEAEAPLRRAVALDPSYSEAWNWLGNSLAGQSRYREAIAAYERAIAIDPLLFPAVTNLASIANLVHDRAASERLVQTITRAGASPDLVNSLKADQAYARGDFSASLALLRAQGLQADGRAKPLLWGNWFDALAATGHYEIMHRITGCPEWYAPLVAGKALPPARFEGKAVTPEEFWTSLFFSAPASRALVELGHSRDLVRLYRAAFRDADDFMLQTDRRGMMMELAPTVAVALRNTGSTDEADYLLSAASARIEARLKRASTVEGLARIAFVRAAQGDRTQALAQLESAVRQGWFPDGRSVALDLAREPAFGAMRGDPRFDAIRRRLLDHAARERAELGPLKV